MMTRRYAIRRLAAHEAGHALILLLLGHAPELVTIMETGGVTIAELPGRWRGMVVAAAGWAGEAVLRWWINRADDSDDIESAPSDDPLPVGRLTESEYSTSFNEVQIRFSLCEPQRDDLELIRRIAAAMKISDPYRWRERAQSVATRYLRQHDRLLLRLAIALEQAKILNQQEILDAAGFVIKPAINGAILAQ